MIPRILVVENERDIAQLLSLHLTSLPAQVELCSDREKVSQKIAEEKWHAMVIDAGTPSEEKLSLIKSLQNTSTSVPTLYLNHSNLDLAYSTQVELGHDQYLTEAYSIQEVITRVKSMLKKSRQSPSVVAPVIHAGKLKLDRHTQQCWVGGEEIQLSGKEFDLLDFFVSHAELVYSRLDLLEQVWGHMPRESAHLVNSHIQSLRVKVMQHPESDVLIQTVWGVGYRFEVKL